MGRREEGGWRAVGGGVGCGWGGVLRYDCGGVVRYCCSGVVWWR